MFTKPAFILLLSLLEYCEIILQFKINVCVCVCVMQNKALISICDLLILIKSKYASNMHFNKLLVNCENWSLN